MKRNASKAQTMGLAVVAGSIFMSIVNMGTVHADNMQQFKNTKSKINMNQTTATLYTWMDGSQLTNQSGNYGTLGMEDSNNTPGARGNSTSWYDKSGHLWMFGGYGYSEARMDYLNDLWQYDLGTGKWAWMGGSKSVNQKGVYGTQGVGSVDNIPGSREDAISWTDSNGNLWMFGGSGYYTESCAGWFDSSPIGYLNDLWQYNSSTQEWTWLSGTAKRNQAGQYGDKGVESDTNMPGSRFGSANWTDSNGNLWMFGGLGFGWNTEDPGSLADLWKYNVSTKKWTWVNGSQVLDQTGKFGTQGVASNSTAPGSRYGAVSWTDKSGNLWLFGGFGYANCIGYLNDLWMYDIASNKWTWVGGSNVVDQYGVYGTQSIASANNTPGARYAALGWSDEQNNLWLFGGNGYANSSAGELNDLWQYNQNTKEWTWVSGSNLTNQASSYGTEDTASSSNVIGARDSAIAWSDGTSQAWLFGGYSSNDSHNAIKNDLWNIKN